MNPTDDLSDALAGDEPDFDTEPSAPLDLDQVTQWVEQVARVRRLLDEYRQAHAAAVQRLNDRLNQRVEDLTKKEKWYEEALEVYHKVTIQNDPKALTIETPAGTLKSRMGQVEWEFFDEAAFTAWALENLPEVIAEPPPPPAPKPAKKEVKKALKDEAAKALKVAGTSDAVLACDGAPVPGLRVLPAKRKYDVVT
jgi:hypothetical protein